MCIRDSPTGFKHTGLFPEQCANWQFMQKAVTQSGRRDVSVLNLFAYTGGATVACAKAGAAVTHVDAAKSMVAWAKENAALSGLLEDVYKRQSRAAALEVLAKTMIPLVGLSSR